VEPEMAFTDLTENMEVKWSDDFKRRK